LFCSFHGGGHRQLGASTLEDMCKVLQKAGYEYLSLAVLSPTGAHPERFTKDDTAKMRRTVKKYGIKITSFGVIWPSYYVMAATSDEEFNRNLNYAKKLADLAVELDAKAMNLGGGAGGRAIPMGLTGRDTRTQALELIAKLWKEASKYYEEKKVMVGPESNGKGILMDDIKEQMQVVDMVGSPSFGITADFRPMYRIELSIANSLRAAGRRIKLIHIADNNGEIPGRGTLDFVEIFRALKDIGYDGELCLEASLGENYLEALKESKKFIEEKWAQA